MGIARVKSETNMKRLLNTRLYFLLMFFLVVGSASVQEMKTLSESSFERARGALDRGVQALGDLKNFQTIEDVAFNYRAKVTEIGQSARPDATDYVRWRLPFNRLYVFVPSRCVIRIRREFRHDITRPFNLDLS